MAMPVRLKQLVVLMSLLMPVVAGATVIDTTPANTQIFYFGEPDTTTYGQVITVPADPVLNSFTFYVALAAGGPANFRGYVMAWDPGNFHATGPVLYESANYSTSSATLDPYTFSVGALALTPGSQYVLFINNSFVLDSINDESGFGGRSTNVYPGGQFVFLNSAGSFAPLTTDPWSTWFVPDAAFQAQFSPVPEPGSLLLLGSGLTLLGVRRRRNRQAPSRPPLRTV